MQLKSAALWFGAVLVLISAACGPVGPALGLGPALDPFVGLILLVALVLGAGLAGQIGGPITSRASDRKTVFGNWTSCP
jgi:hypothetical protein